MSESLQPHGLQCARPPCPSPTPGAYSNSCLSSQWCYPPTSSSVILFFSCLQSFPESGSFLVSHFTSGGQNIGVSCFSFVLGKFLMTNLCPNCTFSSLKQRMLSSTYRNSQVNKCHLSHQPCCQLQFHFQWKGKIFLNLKPSFFAYHFLEIRTDSLRSWIMT